MNSPLPGSLENVYEKYYACNAGGRENEDFLILRHPTDISVLCLGPRHPILTGTDSVVSISFRKPPVPTGGKKKKWAKHMKFDEKMGTIRMESGAEYTIYPSVAGKLYEINEKLVGNPNLAKTSPQFNGFLAIIGSQAKEFKQGLESKRLKSKAEYINTASLWFKD